jgi:hypothetical protein
MDEAALRELPKINARTPYLAMLANFAVMGGLVGTITGMIKSFGSAAGADASQKAAKLAEGISEALNCTAFGIGVSPEDQVHGRWGTCRGLGGSRLFGGVSSRSALVFEMRYGGALRGDKPWPRLTESTESPR